MTGSAGGAGASGSGPPWAPAPAPSAEDGATPWQLAKLAREALDVLRPTRDKARRARLPLMASLLDRAIRDAEQVVAAVVTDA